MCSTVTCLSSGSFGSLLINTVWVFLYFQTLINSWMWVLDVFLLPVWTNTGCMGANQTVKFFHLLCLRSFPSVFSYFCLFLSLHWLRWWKRRQIKDGAEGGRQQRERWMEREEDETRSETERSSRCLKLNSSSAAEKHRLLLLLLLFLLRSSSPCRRRSPRGCHGEDAGVVRVLRGRGQEHQAGLVPDRLRDPQPLHPGLLLAQPDPAEPPEQAGQLHGEPGHTSSEEPPPSVRCRSL